MILTVRSLAAAMLLALIMLTISSTARAFEWENGPGYRRAKLASAGTGKDGFTLLGPEQTGIFFTNFLSEERTLSSQILPSGCGVAAGDVDGDGSCDLYFCGLKIGNRLYRNLGNWKFEDITERAGVACTNLDATGAALVDLNGDGALDLVVNSLGDGTHLFFNDGKGHFTESQQVLNPELGGMSLALADYDGDGWLDLYVANYRVTSAADLPGLRYNLRTINGQLIVASINGRPLTDPEWTNRFLFNIHTNAQGQVKFAHEELGEPDRLYRNLGNGRFELVPFTGGAFLDEDGKPLIEPPRDWGLSVMFRDLNGDGKPDIYLCNDFNTPDRIWLNDGNGRFRALPRLAMRQISFSSMAIDVADINRDGLDDLLVVDMLSREHRSRLMQRTTTMKADVLPLGAIANRPQYPRNMLQLNRGDGTYAEIAQYAGLEASEWSWTCIFLDVDLDGYEDVLLANGFTRDERNLDALDASQRINMSQRGALLQSRRLFPPLVTANLAFRNVNGLTFIEVGHLWGFDTKVISQGMCLADLDNDGDMDVVANNFNAAAGLYRNDAAKPRVAVVLKGKPPNTQGIGAKVKVYGGPVPVQSQEIISGGRYLSCDQAIRVFAAGSLTNLLQIEVDWPSGRRSVVNDAPANYLYEIKEADAEALVPRSTPKAMPYFHDVSRLLTHTHHENLFDDFAQQPTLPKRLSQLGPGICWCDLNGDGWDDLVIGSGNGGSPGIFMNDGKGGFQPCRSSPPVAQDQTTILSFPAGPDAASLLIGLANYEGAGSNAPCVQQIDVAAGTVKDVVPAIEASVGPLALGDLDGDGNLALFVGARVKPGRYPEPVSSRIYRARGSGFLLDELNSKVVAGVGLVSGALWSDLDGDGYPELILACEWGPLRIFHNDHGRLSPTNFPVTFPSGAIGRELSTINQLSGWWNGVTTGDLDGDGRLDVIASNWGQNSRYESHRTAAPLRLYFADFNEEGVLGLIEAYFEPAMKKYVPERRLDQVARAMPFLRGRFPTYQSFADASVEAVLGERVSQVRFLEANWLESTVFLNRGDRFEVRQLPAEAQFSPAFSVIVADYDGDGLEDVFLSQNFFAVEPETSRYDAGRGLWLKGDGKGGLTAVPGQESGIVVYGEQRGAAVADFDGDGRVDLVVSQNAAETHLFRNVRAQPGLQVRLKGPAGNPLGIGVQMRIKRGDHWGPTREVHGGSGYWSQDSETQVLGNVAPPAQLWLRWPGGQSFIVDVPADAAGIQVGSGGVVSTLKQKGR